MFSIKKLFDVNARRLRSFEPIIKQIDALEPKYQKLSDTKLAAQTHIFKKQLKNGKTLDDILPDAFAVVRQAILRTVGERAYPVQLSAALTLHQGAIAQLRTGEGKSHALDPR